MRNDTFDVAIVGYGPVGKGLALMLSRRGYSVSIVERWDEPYPFPRAVCMDHEIRRVMNSLGLADELAKVSAPSPRYQWFGAQGQMLLDIDWTVESVSGGPEAYFFHQPSLEAMMDRELRRISDVEINSGWEMIDFEQDGDGITLRIRQRVNPEQTKTISAKFLIGADGANSQVREQSGIEWQDLGFQADWLVVDVLPNEGVELRVPEAGQSCKPSRPTTFVPGGIENGRRHRRWEFMRLPSETMEELQQPEKVWSLLSPWIGPHEAQLIRHALYTFRSRVAANWRNGRVLLAGDAAHVMPPFMGQGMCSGLRDAWNLTWRLDLVLSGKTDIAILDSYSEERKDHVTEVINLSVQLGKIICVADEAEAAARDQTFLSGLAPPPPKFPDLKTGLLYKPRGYLSPFAGQLGVHGQVSTETRSGSYDAVVGAGFSILGWEHDPRETLPQEMVDQLDSLGAKFVAVHAQRPASASSNTIQDITGKYEAFFRSNGLSSLVARPDYYLYGVARDATRLRDMLQHLLGDLGIHKASSVAPGEKHQARRVIVRSEPIGAIREV